MPNRLVVRVVAAALPLALAALVATTAANPQTCALCKMHPVEGTCDVPTILNSCGCCPGGGKN